MKEIIHGNDNIVSCFVNGNQIFLKQCELEVGATTNQTWGITFTPSPFDVYEEQKVSTSGISSARTFTIPYGTGFTVAYNASNGYTASENVVVSKITGDMVIPAKSAEEPEFIKYTITPANTNNLDNKSEYPSPLYLRYNTNFVADSTKTYWTVTDVENQRLLYMDCDGLGLSGDEQYIKITYSLTHDSDDWSSVITPSLAVSLPKGIRNGLLGMRTTNGAVGSWWNGLTEYGCTGIVGTGDATLSSIRELKIYSIEVYSRQHPVSRPTRTVTVKGDITLNDSYFRTNYTYTKLSDGYSFQIPYGTALAVRKPQGLEYQWEIADADPELRRTEYARGTLKDLQMALRGEIYVNGELLTDTYKDSWGRPVIPGITEDTTIEIRVTEWD